MDSAAAASLAARQRDNTRDLLRALAARAAFPRQPGPAWPDPDSRRPPPPLAEILYTLAPSGTAPEAAAVAAANQRLVAALAAHQQLACASTAVQAARHPADFHAVLAAGDREQLALLLADLAAELQTLDFIRAAAPREAPGLDPDVALFLWREYLLPWARHSQVEYVMAPA